MWVYSFYIPNSNFSYYPFLLLVVTQSDCTRCSLNFTDLVHLNKEISTQIFFLFKEKISCINPQKSNCFKRKTFFSCARLKEPIFCLEKHFLYLPGNRIFTREKNICSFSIVSYTCLKKSNFTKENNFL